MDSDGRRGGVDSLTLPENPGSGKARQNGVKMINWQKWHTIWRGRIVVECTRLESAQGVKALGGSNPPLSAKKFRN